MLFAPAASPLCFENRRVTLLATRSNRQRQPPNGSEEGGQGLKFKFGMYYPKRISIIRCKRARGWIGGWLGGWVGRGTQAGSNERAQGLPEGISHKRNIQATNKNPVNRFTKQDIHQKYFVCDYVSERCERVTPSTCGTQPRKRAPACESR